MASAYLPVLLVSVSTNVVPDDSTLVTLPRGQVDYLSHEWQEEDVWRSWRNMTRQKNEIANGARLENASWRTWWKQRNKLKTVSPETLNWLKDSDVTWLYGPLHTAVEWTPPPKPVAVPDSVDAPTNADAHSRLHLARPRARPSAPVTKPILKHRSISELLTSDFPNPTSPIFSPPESDDEHDSVGSPDAAGTGTHAAKLAAQLSAKRPPLPHTKSDTHIIRWGASRAFRPSSPPRIDPPGHAPAGTDSAAGSTTANPPKKKHISFNTFVEQCIAIEKPKKNASGFFNVGMDPMGAWNQGAGFVDDDGYDEDQEDEDLDEEDEDEGWDGSGARAIRSDSDEDSGSNPEEDEPGGQRAIGVIQEDDEDEEEEDDDDDDVLQMRTPRSHSSMSNATVTLAGTGALDPATSSTTDSTLTASNATPRTTKKQPRSQSVSTASSSSSSTSATTTTSGPSAPSTSASSPASSLSPARREGSTRRKGSLSPGTDSAKNGEGEVPPATAAGRPRHRRRTAAQPTSAVGMSRTRSSSSSHSRGGHVTIAPIAPTMLKTGGAWEESFGDEGGSDDGLGYGYTYSPGTESVLDGRWTWNEGRGKRTSSGGGVKKSGNTRYPQREKTGEEGEGTHDGDADAVANTRANAVSPRPKSTKERENYRAEKATPVELVYAPPKGSGYAAYGYGQGGMYGGYGPNSNGTHADLRNNVDNNGSSNASANWTPGPSAYAEGSMADAGAAYGYAPGARGGGMGVYAGYGRTTLGGYSGKNGFSDEGAEEERVEVVEDDGDGPVVSASTSSAQTTTPPIGIPISQPAHVGDDGFLLGSAPRTSGSGMEALERSRGRGRQDNYFAYPYAHAASYQPTTVGQEEHVRQQHAAETLLQQRLLARQPTPYVDEEDATDFFGAGADYFYARRGGRGYEPASARSGFMDEDGQIEDVRGADPVRGAQDELHARERGGYLVPPTATRGRTDDERPSRSRSRSHSRTPSPAFLAANTAVNATPSGHPGAAPAPSPAPAIPPSTAATTGRRRSASASNPSTPGTWMSAAAALPTPEHLLALQSPASLLAQARPSAGRTSSQNASGQGQQRAEPQRASPPQQPQVQQGERRGRSSTRTPSASSSSWERERGTSIGSSPIGSLSPDTGAQAAPIEAVLGGSAGALAGGGRERREDGERGRERGRERRGRDRTSGKVLGASLAANPPPVGLGLVNAEGDGEVESSCGSSVAGDAQSTSTAQSVSTADSSSSAGRPTVVDASVYAPSSGSSSATITGQGQQRPATPTLAIPGRFPADEADVAHVDVLQAHENPAAAELRHLRRAEEEQRRRVHPTPSNSPVVEVRRMAPVQRTSTVSSSSGSGGTTPTSTTPSPSPSATTPRGLSPSTKTKQLRPPPLVPSPPVPAKPSTSFTAVSSPRRAVAPTLPSVSGVVGPASPVAAPVPTHAPAADTIVAKAVDMMSSAGAYLRLWGHNDAA